VCIEGDKRSTHNKRDLYITHESLVSIIVNAVPCLHNKKMVWAEDSKLGLTPACVKIYNSQDTMSAT
jgi:hypothetical protein